MLGFLFQSECYIGVLNKLLISIFNWIHIRRIVRQLKIIRI